MDSQLINQSWLNGQLATSINISDRGLAYGHGVFETLRVHKGNVPLLSWHLERLLHGCDVLGISVNKLQVQQYLDIALRYLKNLNLSESVVKITVTAGTGARGYKARLTQPCYVVQLFDAPKIEAIKMKQGVKLYCCNYPLPENHYLAGIKHLNRLDQVVAAMEFEAVEYADGLMLNSLGNPIETISRNIFFKISQCWVTPLLNSCGVAGVMRQYLLDKVFPILEIKVSQQLISPQEMMQATEVFVCNSVTGIWPVVELANERLGDVGVDTALLIGELGAQLACFDV